MTSQLNQHNPHRSAQPVERVEAPIKSRPDSFRALRLVCTRAHGRWLHCSLWPACCCSPCATSQGRASTAAPALEQTASRLFKAPVSIGRIDASWRGFNPHLTLSDIRVTGDGVRRSYRCRE